MQEFDFDIKYHKGFESQCRCSFLCSELNHVETAAVTITMSSTQLLRQCQQQDPITKQLPQALETSTLYPKDKQWN